MPLWEWQKIQEMLHEQNRRMNDQETTFSEERNKIREVLRGVSSGDEDLALQKRTVKVAGIQFSATPDREQNIIRAVKFAEVALQKEANMVCFSELFSLPWFSVNNPEDFFRFAEPIPGPSTEPFMKLAQQSGAIILCSIYEKDGDHRYNTVAVLGPGGVIGKYRKIQLSQIPFWEEHHVFDPGTLGFPVFDTPFCRIGIQIGWDNFFPEGSRLLALKNADILFAPTAAAMDSQDRWQNVLCANAIVNNVFIMRVNRSGKEGDLAFYGKSLCVDPFGELIAQPIFHRDALLITELDLGCIDLARKEFAFLKERRSELYSDLL